MPDITRRNLFVLATHAFSGLITAMLGLPALIYLLVPPKLREKEEWIEIGDITMLSSDTPLEMVFRRNRVDGWKVVSEKSTAWVVKHSDHVIAFSPECTHLGCAYHWEDARKDFVCPCHNSIFARDGKVVDGPAPRPLDRYQTKVEGKKILLGPLRLSPEDEDKA